MCIILLIISRFRHLFSSVFLSANSLSDSDMYMACSSLAKPRISILWSAKSRNEAETWCLDVITAMDFGRILCLHFQGIVLLEHNTVTNDGGIFSSSSTIIFHKHSDICFTDNSVQKIVVRYFLSTLKANSKARLEGNRAENNKAWVATLCF